VQEIAFARPAAAAAGDLAEVVAGRRDGEGTPLLAGGRRAAGRRRDPVSCRPAICHLVLAELLANAAEAAPDGARVTIVTTAAISGRLALHVADEGPGLPPALLAEATALFVTTKPGRLGIGLARVDTVMEMHGLPWSLTNRARRRACCGS